MTQHQPIIYVCSDAVGETAETVARATIRQFSNTESRIKRYGHIQTDEEIHHILKEAAQTGGIIAYTLVQPELGKTMKTEAIRYGVRAVDVLGPLMRAYIDAFESLPTQQSGLLHELDDAYFRQIEAIEFAVRCDDGKDLHGLLKADVVLIGVSRTSKTPLSIFLAHKGIKVANLPILPETSPPAELYEADNQLIIGLTVDPEHLLQIRTARLKTLGLPGEATYASISQINREVNHAGHVMEQLNCPVINVTSKSIEETASMIMQYIEKSDRFVL